MSFRIAGLDPAPFAHLHRLDDAALAAAGAVRMRVEEANSAPCRVSLDDAAPGEYVILLNHQHQDAATPYRQQGPIFVSETKNRFDAGAIPPAMRRRTLSLRGFDAADMMIEADLVEGAQAEGLIARFFANRHVAYIHAHYARRGCFAARIDRA
jgi:hypothetical protein